MDTWGLDDELGHIHHRRAEVLRLRQAGTGIGNIAISLGIAPATVSKDIAWLRANGHKTSGSDVQLFQGSKKTGDPSRTAELRHRIITMRLEGYNPREIARTLGVALETVQGHLTAVFNGLTQVKAEQARALELDRLDYLLTKLQPGIEYGDPKSIALAIQISKQRAQYIPGVLAPIKTETTVITMDAIDAEITRLEQELAQVTGEPSAIEGEVVG
jgi:DNA-binding CsgD family transcriptional regulator